MARRGRVNTLKREPWKEWLRDPTQDSPSPGMCKPGARSLLAVGRLCTTTSTRGAYTCRRQLRSMCRIRSPKRVRPTNCFVRHAHKRCPSVMQVAQGRKYQGGGILRDDMLPTESTCLGFTTS